MTRRPRCIISGRWPPPRRRRRCCCPAGWPSAIYSSALLADGQHEAAVDAAQQAIAAPGEDVRSAYAARAALARALAADGLHGEAEIAAREAVGEAYATEQTSERAAADVLLKSLG